MFLTTPLDQKKTVIYLITFIFTLSFFTLAALSPAQAEDLKSSTFEIQMSTVNLTGGRKTNAGGTIILTDTVGQTFQGRFDGAGFVIQAGFQYINTLIPFSFKISNLDINFGSLVPGVPSLRSNTLTVTTGSAFGYSVKVIEDHPLRMSNGITTIPDTNCDLATPCLPTDANAWSDNARYGFGYNMDGNDIDTGDFQNSSYYRPFPVQNVDQPAIVMSKGGVATVSAATVTYKINIDAAQAAGTYQNSIQYIAIPAF
jgi:hypothetical protein